MNTNYIWLNYRNQKGNNQWERFSCNRMSAAIGRLSELNALLHDAPFYLSFNGRVLLKA